jgi:hypothetical protein
MGKLYPFTELTAGLEIMTPLDETAAAAIRRRSGAKALWAAAVGIYLIAIVCVRFVIRYWSYPSTLVMPLFGAACMLCAGIIVAGVLVWFWPTRLGQVIAAIVISVLVFLMSLFIFVFGPYVIPRTTDPKDGGFNYVMMVILSVGGGSLLFMALRLARLACRNKSGVTH